MPAGGGLVTFVDGWSYEFGGGNGIAGGDCGRNQTNQKLQTALPGGIDQLQSALDGWSAAAGLLAAPIRDGRASFRALYLLPANANTSPSGTTDTDDDIALVLLPALTDGKLFTRLTHMVTAAGGHLAERQPGGHSLAGTIPLDRGAVPFLFALAPASEPARSSAPSLAQQAAQLAASQAPASGVQEAEEATPPQPTAAAPEDPARAAAPARRPRRR
jgi:hypothetical protein